MTSEPELAERLVEIAHRVDAKGFVAATDGNISVRLPNGNVLTTPTSVKKEFVTIEDLVEVTINGDQVKGKRKPSTELKMHLFIYQHRKDIQAVVHCHPIYATGFAAAGIPLKENIFPEVIVGLGKVPLAPYATPSTTEVTDSIEPFVEKYDAIMLSNHGVVTYGIDLWDAYLKMEKVEQTAHMLFVAEMIGGPKGLDQKQVEHLNKLSKTIYKK